MRLGNQLGLQGRGSETILRRCFLVVVWLLSRCPALVTPWAGARQAPLPLEQLPFPPPRGVVTQGSNQHLLPCGPILYR